MQCVTFRNQYLKKKKVISCLNSDIRKPVVDTKGTQHSAHIAVNTQEHYSHDALLICYAIYTVMYLVLLCLYCCPGKCVSHYLGDLHASGLTVGLNCRSPDQKHAVKINILLLFLLIELTWVP